MDNRYVKFALFVDATVRDNHKHSSLWMAAFTDPRGEISPVKEQIASLISELTKLDKSVADILTRIPNDCKGLTLHDIDHCHQLWDVASQICGEQYQLNPAEGFVLGAAFLIHDIGLTAAAYPGWDSYWQDSRKSSLGYKKSRCYLSPARTSFRRVPALEHRCF